MSDDRTLAEEPVEETDEQQHSARAEAVGSGLVKTVKLMFLPFYAILSGFYYGVGKKIPKTSGIADGLIRAGHKQKIKLSGADVICNVIYGDGVVVPRAAWWNSKEMEFKTDNGETFSARGIGFDPKRLDGKHPVVWALAESAEITEPLEGYMAGQAKVGNFEETARADGGSEVLLAGETPGVVGRVLSFRDGYEMFGSKVTQEDMELQATRAKLAEMDLGGHREIIMVLVFAGGCALGLFGPSLAQSIAGQAGGAASGINVGLGALMAWGSLGE